MTVTAIIITYNSAEVIISALECVCNHPYIAQCIIVDNASTDQTLQVVRQFPKATIIENKSNLGFGRACNLALEQITTDFVFLLNPDAVIDSEGINKLVSAFERYPNAAIIVPHCVQPQPNKQNFASGAVAMWKMQAMKNIGFFDPAFFLFYEDDDISLRTIKSGYQIILLPEIKATHTPGKSCAQQKGLDALKLRSSVWSRLYMLRKYKGRVFATCEALWIIINSLIKMLFTWSIFSDSEAEDFYKLEIKKLEIKFRRKWQVIARQQPFPSEQKVKNHEAQWQAATKRLEEKYIKIKNHLIEKNKINSAWYFLKNPKYFNPYD